MATGRMKLLSSLAGWEVSALTTLLHVETGCTPSSAPPMEFFSARSPFMLYASTPSSRQLATFFNRVPRHRPSFLLPPSGKKRDQSTISSFNCFKMISLLCGACPRWLAQPGQHSATIVVRGPDRNIPEFLWAGLHNFHEGIWVPDGHRPTRKDNNDEPIVVRDPVRSQGWQPKPLTSPAVAPPSLHDDPTALGRSWLAAFLVAVRSKPQNELKIQCCVWVQS